MRCKWRSSLGAYVTILHDDGFPVFFGEILEIDMVLVGIVEYAHASEPVLDAIVG